MSIEQTKAWFAAAVPNPTEKNKAVQIGCHFEEVGEMGDALGDSLIGKAMGQTGEEFKTGGTIADLYGDAHTIDRAALLDSLADQIVTAVGVAHMFGMDIVGALAEVNRSNFSKFVDGSPVFNENGKIVKGPNYSAPDLSKYL